MWNEILAISFILGLLFISGILIVLGKFFKKLLPAVTIIAKEKPKVHKPISVSSVYDAEIYKVLCKIQQETQASKVIVARFHNGGSYRNGLDMEKFTITHETNYGASEPMQNKHVATLNSRYGSAFLVLATLGYYTVIDVADCPDPNFKHDMKYYGYESTHLFLMKQFNGEDEGFIGLNFKHTTILTSEQINSVQNHILRIVGLLNMNEDILKNKNIN